MGHCTCREYSQGKKENKVKKSAYALQITGKEFGNLPGFVFFYEWNSVKQLLPKKSRGKFTTQISLRKFNRYIM